MTVIHFILINGSFIQNNILYLNSVEETPATLNLGTILTIVLYDGILAFIFALYEN